jgi:hypothetical protein
MSIVRPKTHWLVRLALRVPLRWNVIRIGCARVGLNTTDYLRITLGGYSA